MSVPIIIVLILLGIILLLIEFLVIPGFTIAGIAGFIFVGGGIFCGYFFYDTNTGNYILLGTGAVMIITFGLVLKSKTWRRFGLDATINSTVGGFEKESIKPGDTGKTISRLAPIGKALINDKLLEVHSDGNYVDQNREIIVTRIEGNKIIVKTKN